MTTTLDNHPVFITEEALSRALTFLKEAPHEGVYLRLGVKGGGCSGFQYALTMDKAREGDICWEQGGLPIALDADSQPYMNGSTLSWRSTLQESGFHFDNPNARAACGCGSSFRVDEQDGCDSAV